MMSQHVTLTEQAAAGMMRRLSDTQRDKLISIAGDKVHDIRNRHRNGIYGRLV